MEYNSNILLEIFIITYNRASHLASTLQQLIGCPFVKFSITILDNYSEDDTYEVFLKYRNLFPNLNYIKNKINIGADANVLRAAEYSDSNYTWILCDDDDYDFAYCDDIIQKLYEGEVDAIMVGWHDAFKWPDGGLLGTPAELIKNNFPYFGVPSFVPGSIFKTHLFQKQIRYSYENIINLYPALTYYIKLYKENMLIYVSKNKIVNAAAKAEYHYSFLRIMDGFINTIYMIDQHHIRKKLFIQVYPKPSYKSIIIDYALVMRYHSNVSVLTLYRYLRLLDFNRRIFFLFGYICAPLIYKFAHNNKLKLNQI